MTLRSTGKRAVYTDANALEAIGRALREIKNDDGLTWSDVAKVLGIESDDQAAKYASGLAAMKVTAFGRAKREWNGRFTGYFDRLCEDSRPGKNCDHSGQTSILAAALALSVALEDGEIDADEVRANRATLENARDALEAQLAKLRPTEARA